MVARTVIKACAALLAAAGRRIPFDKVSTAVV